MNTTENKSIQCSVTGCSHHCKSRDYCSLNEIKVGCADPMTASCKGTECDSFCADGGACHK